MWVLHRHASAGATRVRASRTLSIRSRNFAAYIAHGYFGSVLSLISAALAVATAWIALPQQKRHPSATSLHWNDLRNVSKFEVLTSSSKTWCEAPSIASDGNVVGTSTAVNELPFSKNSAVQYELMTVPDRGQLETHAIYGSLMKSNCIERYDVYRARRSRRIEGNINSVKEVIPDVVGIVTVGENLDGHTGILHGGIIALIIDDVLGFGYYAVLMDEFESFGNNDFGAMNDYTDVVAVTANLNINFRAPLPSGSTFIVEATLVSDGNDVERRANKNKFHWEVQVSTLDRSMIFCQASSLYVIPKHAPNMIRK